MQPRPSSIARRRDWITRVAIPFLRWGKTNGRSWTTRWWSVSTVRQRCIVMAPVVFSAVLFSSGRPVVSTRAPIPSRRPTWRRVSRGINRCHSTADRPPSTGHCQVESKWPTKSVPSPRVSSNRIKTRPNLHASRRICRPGTERVAAGQIDEHLFKRSHRLTSDLKCAARCLFCSDWTFSVDTGARPGTTEPNRLPPGDLAGRKINKDALHWRFHRR